MVLCFKANDLFRSGVETVGFNPLFQISTRERYSKMMTKLLLCLLRSTNQQSDMVHIIQTTDDELINALSALRSQLEDLWQRYNIQADDMNESESLCTTDDLFALHQVLLRF